MNQNAKYHVADYSERKDCSFSVRVASRRIAGWTNPVSHHKTRAAAEQMCKALCAVAA